MKKNTSATNARPLKDTKPATSKAPVKKDGRGGSGRGQGRKKEKGETVQWHIDVPVEIDTIARRAKVTNKTAFVIDLLKAHFKIE